MGYIDQTAIIGIQELVKGRGSTLLFSIIDMDEKSKGVHCY